MARRSSATNSGNLNKGVYANYFEVGHTAFEFVLDFGLTYAGKRPRGCHTRIVTSPVYVQALLRLLRDAVTQYERSFGPVGRDE